MENTDIGEELRTIVDHAEALLGALSGDVDARLDRLRARVAESIDTARARLAEMDRDVERPSERAAAAFEQWMQDNPWMAVAIGAGIGVAIGYLLSGRRVASPP